jgi:lipopolysaccharide transport system ATP-binding protein
MLLSHSWSWRRRLFVLDDFFPNLLTGFRVAEYNAYLEVFPRLRVLSSNRDFSEHWRAYASLYPTLAARVTPFKNVLPRDCRLAYMNFLNNAFAFLGQLERRQVPFLVTLYPGGGLGLEEPESDAKLNIVLSSPLLQGIIATQRVTLDYVQGRNVRRVPTYFIPGIVANPLYFTPLTSRRYFGENKDTLDICFVAEKYMPGGVDKGYPTFIATAHALARHDRRIFFHVVGNFGQEDGDVSQLGQRIQFYGRLPTSELRQFFSRMDLILSPNQPFKLRAGSFDGFPTGACVEAALCGVGIVATDILNQNPGYVDGKTILLVSPDVSLIVDRISALLADPEKLVSMARSGQTVTSQLYAPERQIGERLSILRAVAERHNIVL